MSDTSIPVAFSAGVLSFLSPCVLPLVPVYLANMAGVAVLDRDSGTNFRTPLTHALVFVAGFTIVFTLLGASVGLLGFAFDTELDNKIAGGALIFFGVFLLASFKIPQLNYQNHMGNSLIRGAGYTRSLLIGAAFALGWTPCVGPILGAVLTLAYDSDTALKGAYLLMIYSMGLGLPFILMSLGVNRARGYLSRFSRFTPLVSLAGSFLLMLIGSLMYFDKLAWLGNEG